MGILAFALKISWILLGGFYLLCGFRLMFLVFFRKLNTNNLGIKTKWVLKDENVRNKTNKLSGILMTVSGVLFIILAFFVNKEFLLFIRSSRDTRLAFNAWFCFILCFPHIATAIYSYLLYKKNNN